MHHVILERWSRRASPLHARDARVKLVAALLFLVLVATTPPRNFLAFGLYFGLLLAALFTARLPLYPILARAGVVLPFSIVFATVSWFAGDPARAVALILRGYLSAASVLLLVSTSRLPDLLRALEWFHVPALLILVTQFLYRYLFVLSEQAHHMRLAARSRRGTASSAGARRSRFHAAAGALSVLFARSYLRADGVHRSMLARGFSGHFPSLAQTPARSGDFLFLTLAVAALLAVRVVAL